MSSLISQADGAASLPNILQSESFKRQVAMALPRHMTPDRFLRIALTELRKNPKLNDCDHKSFLGAIVQCSQLGLEPGDGRGLAYLIPYGKDCQLQIGYKGLMELARRSDQIQSIQAQCMYSNDLFEFEYGLDDKLRHIPSRDNRGEMIGAYAIAKFKDGGYQFEVMFKEAIDKIKSTSKAAKSSYSPWNTHYDEMARKTVVRRLCKYLPSSPELQQAITIDEKADLGIQKNDIEYSATIDGETGEIVEEKTKSQSEDLTSKLKSKDDIKFE